MLGKPPTNKSGIRGPGCPAGGCSGPMCGGARRRPPPPPEPSSSLAADLSELSLDQGYHTLADCGPPRRKRDRELSDALWLRILSYLEVSDLCRLSPRMQALGATGGPHHRAA
ncbi:hypothetical protein ACJJTC_001432 [Scirpophaga incertulas]